jgi:PAS domain S-box-containing protein
MLLVLVYAAAIMVNSWVGARAELIGELSTVAELESKAINGYLSSLARDLTSLGDELAAAGRPLDLGAAHRLVKRLHDRRPELVNVTLIAPDGAVLLSAKFPPGATPPATLAREPSFVSYLEELKQGGATLRVGQPLVGLSSKVVIVPVRYGVKDAQGHLAFVVSANLPHEYLRSFWMDAPITSKASIGLIRDNGFLLSRYPISATAMADLPQVYGKPRTGALIEHLRRAGFPAQGQVTGMASTDGIEVVTVFRRLPDFPVTLFVALPASALRGFWYERTTPAFLATLLLAVGGAVSYRYAIRSQLALEGEHKRLEEARLKADAQFQLMADSAPVLIWIAGTDQLCFWFNKVWLDFTGRTLAQEVGSGWTDGVHVDDLQRCLDTSVGAFEARRAFSLEYRLRRFDGEYRWLLGNGVPRCDVDGRFLGYIGSCIDITERRAAEAELQRHRDHLEGLVAARTAALSIAKEAAEAASRAKSTFLATMSHELRTPLNAIMGMTSLARMRATDPKQIDQLTKVGTASRQLLSIITDILDISRIEARKLQLMDSDLGVGQVLRDVETLVRSQADAKHIELTVNPVADLGTMPLRGDAQRLTQILVNLVGNAVKFTEAGSVTVSARLLQDGGEQVVLRFEVIDTGVGIAAFDQRRLFQAFEQVDGSFTRKHGGTGLGLAISKQLVEMMGGEIGLESQVGVGSTFWFTVKLAKVGQRDGPQITPSSPSAKQQLLDSHAGAHVLVAEDDLFNQEVAQGMLEEVGLVAHFANNGAKAVEMARRVNYDLILMDVQMPVMDGLEATRQIRALANNPNVPIVAMTANVFPEDEARCRQAGMNDFLARPVGPEVFSDMLLMWLERSKA